MAIEEELAKRFAEFNFHVRANAMPDRNHPLLTENELRNRMPIEGINVRGTLAHAHILTNT